MRPTNSDLVYLEERSRHIIFTFEIVNIRSDKIVQAMHQFFSNDEENKTRTDDIVFMINDYNVTNIKSFKIY